MKTIKMLCVIAAALVMANNAGNQARADWEIMTPITINRLNSIWGSSGSNVFSVGASGTILNYNGSRWRGMTSGTSIQLKSIWGSSGNDVFAVGEGGTILHYNGSSWAPMTSGTDLDLYSIWGSSANDEFIVGFGGTILHYNGSSWSSMTSCTTESLTGVWGSAASNVFAVGRDGIILHYNGSSWASMTSSTDVFLYGIWGSSASDVFAVGNAGTILHYTAPVTTTTTVALTSTVLPTTTSTAPDDTTTTIAASTTTSTAPEQVIADFMVSPGQGYRPLTVNFTNLSQGIIDTSVWTFGDGEESTDRDPVHVYRTPGTYSVSLKVFGSNGTQDTMVRDDCIRVLSRCAIGRTLDLPETVVMLRVLRDVLLADPVGMYVVSRYYAHAEEIGILFDEHKALRRQFRELVRENRAAAEKLIETGRLEVSAAQAARIIEFLQELREVASPQLGHDIALLIKGIEDGWLLPGLGIAIER